MTKPCHGTDHGYVCHLSNLCRHVTADATWADAMLCEHLGFEHFMSHPTTTVGTISKARSDAEKRGIPTLAQALKREYERMLAPRQAPTAPVSIVPIGQTMDLFA